MTTLSADTKIAKRPTGRPGVPAPLPSASPDARKARSTPSRFASIYADPAQSSSFSAGSAGRYDDPHVLARLAALPTMTMAELQAMWRDLNATEPPRYNRKFLESRLAYRIQELTFGGLKPETRARLAALADDLDRKHGPRSRSDADRRPIAGTRLIREWQGVEETVTVLTSGYEWQGRPYQSLSSVARAITGTRWNGWLFFGLRTAGGRR